MKRSLLAACAVTLFFAAAAADLGLRSRAALQEARRQDLWRANPPLKTGYYDGLFKKKLALLDKASAAGRIGKDQAAQQAARLKSERDSYLSESSAKLAWLWYKTAAEKFGSPLNPWAARAQERLPAAREAWRAELAAKNMKIEDWMFE